MEQYKNVQIYQANNCFNTNDFGNLSSVNPFECISFKNQERNVRPEIINISANNPIFYPFRIKMNRCSSNCNNINDPYARICIPDTVNNLDAKVFNLISRTNETRHKMA